jgi:hypothetical protein
MNHHFPFVEDWILDESPMFAQACKAFYEAKKNIAPFATTHMQKWRAAEAYIGSSPIVVRERLRQREVIGRAVRDLDAEYLFKCAKALEYLRDKEVGKTSDGDHLTSERFIIEAYRRLRVIAGPGTSRPSRKEVVDEARRVRAYSKLQSGTRSSYELFLSEIQTNLRFRERVEAEIANTVGFFQANHVDRLFDKLGLSDLAATPGRPRRKGASKHRRVPRL